MIEELAFAIKIEFILLYNYIMQLELLSCKCGQMHGCKGSQ